MKQKDIALIIVVVFIAGIISYFVSSAFISKPQNRQTKVEVVEAISSEFPKADTRYFNSNSINPTQNIQIGNQNNTQPF